MMGVGLSSLNIISRYQKHNLNFLSKSLLSRTSNKAKPEVFLDEVWTVVCGVLKLSWLNLLTLILKLMNTVIHSIIHLSYLKVADYSAEIMCLALQMKTTQDHSLSSRQIKFQTLLL